jgi:hypothetical protein
MSSSRRLKYGGGQVGGEHQAHVLQVGRRLLAVARAASSVLRTRPEQVSS